MAKRRRQFERSESGLWLPDNRRWFGLSEGYPYPECVPARRDPRDTRRYFSRRRCCCCTIFSDDFSENVFLHKWARDEGAWTIGSGVLSTPDSNAMILCDEPGGDEFFDHVIQVSLRASTGSQSRIVFSYNESTGAYNYIEIGWEDTASTVVIYDSTGEKIASQIEQTFVDGEWYDFELCVKADEAILHGIFRGDITSTTPNTGLGTGTVVGEVQFDNFSLEHIKTDDNHCFECYGPSASDCRDCWPSDKTEIHVELPSGWTPVLYPQIPGFGCDEFSPGCESLDGAAYTVPFSGYASHPPTCPYDTCRFQEDFPTVCDKCNLDHPAPLRLNVSFLRCDDWGPGCHLSFTLGIGWRQCYTGSDWGFENWAGEISISGNGGPWEVPLLFVPPGPSQLDPAICIYPSGQPVRISWD